MLVISEIKFLDRYTVSSIILGLDKVILIQRDLKRCGLSMSNIYINYQLLADIFVSYFQTVFFYPGC